MLPDTRLIPDRQRLAAAEQIRTSKDFILPELDFFNSGPCVKHDEVQVSCRQCGVKLRKHQRVGVAWAYLIKKGLLADQVGTGKSFQAAGLIASLKEIGEMDHSRVLIVMRPGAIFQWHAELQRVLPKIQVSVAAGARKNRIEAYLAPWDVMLIGSQMLQQDIDAVEHFEIKTLIVDDVDPLRHADTRTAYCIKRLAHECDRVVVMTGTPLQKKLLELHSVFETLGGRELLGSTAAFNTRYVREENVKLYTRSGNSISTKKIVGYKNLNEFVRLIGPMTLRRTASDIDDVDLPAVIPNNIFLDMYPAQREKYRELKAGVLRVIKEQGASVKRVKAIAQFTYGAQICTGLATIGEADRPNTSVKLDWVEDKIVDGDLSEEKVVVFCQFKNSVRALQSRFDRAGVQYETIWGEQTNAHVRYQSQERFWNDPNCRVLLGTASIEQSLNLQVARHLINVDTLLNPARMEQLSGRIRRDGSAYKSVYVHSLFTNDSQEENYLPLLENEQGLIDFIWGEASELFEALSPLQLLMLIGNSRV